MILEKLSKKELERFLDKRVKLLKFRSVDSTNTLAKKLVINGEKMPFLVITNKQTAGRGRQGKNFYSKRNCGIYMTLAVDKDFVSSSAITAAAAVSVATAINERCSLDAKIKWVNDIYIESKKASGILCEAVKDTDNNLKGYIIGIGINVGIKKFPKDIENIATSIKVKDKNLLAATVINNLLWNLADKDNYFLEKYKDLSLVLGKEIIYTENGKEKTAKAVDIDNNGGLIIEENGKNKTLSGGEISVRIM